MALYPILSPAAEPVALDELKEFLRLDAGDTSQDNLIRALAIAARVWCETYTRRKFVQQTWRLALDYFPGYIDMRLAGSKVSSPFVSGSNAILVGIRYAVVLPYPPVRRIARFAYQNANGDVTSLIQGPTTIATVVNATGRAVEIDTALPHGLASGAPVAIAGNSALAAVLPNQALQVVTVLSPTRLTVNASVGTGTTIAGGGTVTGYNFVADLQSNPARLTPLFGQMWPVARVVVNAVEIDYELGYAAPITVTAAAGGKAISATDYVFTAADVGRPISIPGAGAASDWSDGGGTLNTAIASVSNPPDGNATVRDAVQTDVADVTALLVNAAACNAGHWELIKSGIKMHTLGKFEKRLPDSEINDNVGAILAPVRDLRY
jgi:hypothetical protein